MLRAFSRRRAEIEAAVEANGPSTPSAARVAALDTRQAKDYDVTPEKLAPEWRDRAAALGLEPRDVASLLDRSTPSRPSPAMVEHSARELIDPYAGLTARRSSFTRRDVLQALCERLPVGSTVADVEEIADWFLASKHSVPLVTRDVAVQRDRRRSSVEQLYSTPELLALEAQVVEQAQAGAGVGAALATPLRRSRAPCGPSGPSTPRAAPRRARAPCRCACPRCGP